ncbi:ABC transporter permease [Kaistia dalseonensis]|uniref:Peptide/nickel transport system permease protein n=1 Tax=Kaistia dalseonensis TaxID=410840 RepID=A0ABU0HAB4_9HYPH|nr:ABC transporter permease [Kaistia dalseonensis]MCX5496630.1 ABC transporter permease [Kaistia dalseonensis]MDQ0439253.1 peptide/nickel transport system permease protein [Kaistia dalseonensis]
MAVTTHAAPPTAAKPRSGSFRPIALELWHDKAGMIGFTVIVLLILMAVFAPLIAPYDPAIQSVAARLKPPAWLPKGSWEHVLGTDQLGRDVLSRVIYGARASLLVGTSVVLLAGTFGVLFGLFAGFKGGRIDDLMMRLVDIQVAFPGLLMILLIISAVGPSLSTMIVVLAVTNWMIYARVVRGIVLSVRQTPYVEAAEMIGCKPGRVLFKHILPNLTSPLLTLGILEFTNIVLAEAAMSFLGLGVQPPATSWGLDVSNGKDYIFVAWWLITFPGLSISITVLSINLFANWLRVTTDPQEREKRFARLKAVERRRNGAPAGAPAKA